MPTYEYECSECGHAFEEEQRITDPPLKHCIFNLKGDRFAEHGGVRCGGEVKRLIAGQTGFVLNGSGWFKDGY
jgi:predicted nucleic acid-binding Zn ribbon protein